jgi:predicted RecB family nuclease
MKGRGMASIDTIEGIGHRQATKLRKARIRTTEALLKNGGTRKGRKTIADTTDISEKLILEWVNRADLMRVKGVGEEYSDLLESAGVDTVKELRRRNSANLLSAMVEVNDKKKLVRRLPTESMVERWVNHAKDLEPLVTY